MQIQGSDEVLGNALLGCARASWALALLRRSSTPILNFLFCTQFMHRLDHGDDMIDRSFRQDAVAEIENMAGLTAGATQNFADPMSDFFGRCEQRHRIEVSLHLSLI